MISLLTLIFSGMLFVGAVVYNVTNTSLLNETTVNASPTNKTLGLNGSNRTVIKPILAEVINGKSIFDDSYTEIYLKHYNNFSGIDFKSLNERESSTLLKVGNIETKIEGFILGNKEYAIHLVGCNREKGTCNFRINGAIAKDLSPNGIDTFDLGENYTIRIKSIIIDYCDNRRVCDYYYQAYDLVEVEVVKK